MRILPGRDGLVSWTLRYGIPYGTACCSASLQHGGIRGNSALDRACQRVGEDAVGRRGRRLGRAARALTATVALTGACVALGRLATRLARLVVEAHGKGDALAREVHLHHLHLDDVAGLHRVARILHEAVRERGDVDQ